MEKEDKNILRQIERWTGHEDVRYEIYKSVVGIIVWFSVIGICAATLAIWLFKD